MAINIKYGDLEVDTTYHEMKATGEETRSPTYCHNKGAGEHGYKRDQERTESY